jgi:hypothetical protein
MDAMTGKANEVPDLMITSETGNKANAKIYNVYVGKVSSRECNPC